MSKSNIIIRPICKSDAPDWINLLCDIDRESPFMLWKANERPPSVTLSKQFITKTLKQPHARIFVAQDKTTNQLIGYACGHVSSLAKRAHVMEASIGVRKGYQFGVGRMLSTNIMESTRYSPIKRLEVSIMAPNKLSINLAKKLGFQIEGIKRDAIRLDDTYIDEVIMGYTYDNK